MKLFLALILFVSLISGYGVAQTEWPDLSGSWALFQVISDYWEAPLLGERPRRIYQIAKIRVDQNGADLLLRSESICAMVFDMGTALVQISINPGFLAAVGIGPLSGKLVRSEGGIALVIPEFLVLNGVRLADPLSEPLPTAPDDPRVVDLDGDGKPGFTVKVKVFGLISGETYVVQRLRQEYRGTVLSPDHIRGTVTWKDEQVTLGASASFFFIPGKGRPDPDPQRSFFVLRRIQGEETCEELRELFQEELRE